MNNPVSAIKVLIVDDHSLIRMGLVSLVEGRTDIVLVGQAESGDEAIEMASNLRPDVILMDINMPGMDGLTATKKILAVLPEVRIMILTVSADDQDLFDAIRSGASGYLLKNITSDELCDAIKKVHNEEIVIPQVLMGKLLQQVSKDESAVEENGQDTLTPREEEILTYIVTGASNKEIADVLCLSEYTVKIHVSNILNKLNLKNRIQAAVYALRQGIAE